MRFQIYLDDQWWKSTTDLFKVELELGTAIKQLSFGFNGRVYITLADDFIAEDFIRKGA